MSLIQYSITFCGFENFVIQYNLQNTKKKATKSLQTSLN
jgi:hypothetical protein